MKKIYVFLLLLSFTGFNKLLAQEASPEKKVKSVTGYNLENKKKELDHLTNFNKDGLKTDETEYFSDGKVKNKTVFEYDSNKHCIKETRYNTKGKVEKVVVFEYDATGNKTRENTVNTVKHTRSEKIFEYSYY
jgi:hypothetical protein